MLGLKMALLSNNSKHALYFSVPAILLDTCALTWFANRGTGIDELNKIQAAYRLLIPTTVLYELAFGLPDSVGENESLLRQRFFIRESEIDMYKYRFAFNHKAITPGGFYIINPGYFEWWSAREQLLAHVALKGAETGTTKRNLSFDALIYACARNTLSPICTENVRDFKKLNAARAQHSWVGTVPIYSPDQVLASLESDILFDDDA